MDNHERSQEEFQISPHSQQLENQGVESIKDAVGTIFAVVKIAMVVLIIAFCFSGIGYLEQYEKGILFRFGSMHEDVKEEPGLVLALPYPIDELITVPAKRTQSLESTTFWYKLSDAEKKTGITDKIPQSLKPQVDGYLITADRNIIHARCTLKYRIRNPVNYSFRSANTEQLIRACLDNVMLKISGKITIDEALKNKNMFAQEVTSILTELLHKMDIGVEIDPVDIRLSWPRQLASDINEVVKVEQKYQQNVAAAKVYAQNQQDFAESQAQKVKFEANTWATRKISRSKADAATFKKMYPLYKKNPNIITRTLYQDRMRKIMANVDEIFIIEQSDNREIRINLQRKEKPEKDDDKS